MASKKPLSRAGSAAAGMDNQESNVQVILRCRPPSADELAQRVPQVIKCDEASNAVTLNQSLAGKQLGRTYHFDRVFAPDTTQEHLYSTAVAPMVEEVLQGFNCTIFAYGQTGTGKTHTMTGDIGDAAAVASGAGVIPRAIAQIFAHLDGIGAASEFTVKCSFLELYNEEITDLLAMGNEPPKVRILEDRSGVVLQGLEEPHVKSSADIFTLLEAGNARRRTAETLLNKQSSRSHSVFVVTVSVREVLAEGEEVIRVGKLYLVDLAGSENVSRSGAVDARAKEAGNINKSLLTLGRVITALVEGQGHVPYRDSKLTRILRDSLGGRTKTCIIATIAPTVQCQEETLSTLDYAHRAKNIKNKPELNQKISKTTHLKELAQEIARLKEQLVATRDKNGVYMPASQYDEDCAERERLKARVEELEEEASEWNTRLAEVKAELQAAQQQVLERNHVLEAHKNAEESLATYAVSLTNDLKGAAADVAQLFVRVDAKNSIEENNVQVVSTLGTQAAGKLTTLESALKAAANEHSARLDSVAAELQSLVQRKETETAALSKQMADLQQQIDAVGAAAQGAAESLCNSGVAALSAIEKQQAEYLVAAQTAAKEAAAAVSSAYAALNSSLEQEAAALETLLGGQSAAVGAMHSTTQAIVNALREQLETAQARAGAAQSAVGEVMSAQAAAAEALHTDFAAEVRAEEAALMEQVQALVAGFVSKAEQKVHGAVTSIKGQLAKDQNMLEKKIGTLASDAAAAINVLETNNKQAEEAAQSATVQLEQSGAALSAAVTATAAHGRSAQDAAVEGAAAADKMLQKHAKAVSASIKKDAKHLQSTAEKEGEKCVALVNEAGVTSKAVHNEVSQAFTADEAAATTLLQSNTVGQKAVAALTSSQQAGLAEIAGYVQNAVNDFKTDTAAHMVPAVREYVPSENKIDALRALPESRLLAQFRGEEEAEENLEMLADGEAALNENELPVPTRAAAVQETVEAVLSPIVPGQKKRGRASDDAPQPEQSPSKLRATFQRGERRRAMRHTNAE